MTSESLATLSDGLVYSAMTIYLLSLIAFAAQFAGGRSPAKQTVAVTADGGADLATDSTTGDDAAGYSDRAGRIGLSLAWLGFGLHAAAFVARGLATERMPLGNMYEFVLGGTLAAMGVWLFWSTRRDVRWAGLFVVGPVLLFLGLAVTVLYVEAGDLVPALHSWWLVIHVSAATLCAGLFTVGAVTSALFLLQSRWERTGVTNGFARRLPASETLDRISYRTLAFAFPIWTFAVIAGAIWAEAAWGRYWGWDPKETWAFITWLIFAGYLHARATAGWRGKRAAIIALVGFASFVFNFVGVNIWIPGLHSYGGL